MVYVAGVKSGWVDQDPGPGSEVELESGRHVGAVHAEGGVGHLQPQGRAVEPPGPGQVVHGEARERLRVLQHLPAPFLLVRSQPHPSPARQT
jgi:hypothetical protein